MDCPEESFLGEMIAIAVLVMSIAIVWYRSSMA